MDAHPTTVVSIAFVGFLLSHACLAFSKGTTCRTEKELEERAAVTAIAEKRSQPGRGGKKESAVRSSPQVRWLREGMRNSPRVAREGVGKDRRKTSAGE